MTPASKKPRARTRWAVEWRYPGGKAWRLYASWPGRDDAEMAKEMCAFQHPTREWRVYLKLGRAKSKLTPAKRRARNRRSLKRDQWLEARAMAFERDGGRCSIGAVKACTGRFEEAHHMIKRRAASLYSDVHNLVGACKPCHDWIEDGHMAWMWAKLFREDPERVAYLEAKDEAARRATFEAKATVTELRYPEATPNAPHPQATSKARKQSETDPGPEAQTDDDAEGPLPRLEREG